ncbi:uncharacterized protein FTOL_00340 [Fusarium torulosum]|uniref:Uncharacterized protein n=1 Tax=Fusarium torulosum TaxID=33205 RepID=A0AAE8LY06_9HYPO|nr:uncharacterized protein FTOL_00340 [Fusarium torulosum]
MSGRVSDLKKDRRDLPDRRLPQTSHNSYAPEVSSRLQQSWVPSSNTSNRSASPSDNFGNEKTANGEASTDSQLAQPTRTQDRLHLRGHDSPNSSPPDQSQPHTPRRHRASLSGFNPEAVEFSPSPPQAAYAQLVPHDNFPEAQRANRLRYINQIEDDRDREEAMNDFIFDQATPWTHEDLAREKEELELKRREELFGKFRKSSK